MEKSWQSRAETLAGTFPPARFEPHAHAVLLKISQETNVPAPAHSETAPAIALACSGGADSLCALLLVWAHFPQLRSRLCVLHFNHAQRGKASAGDAAFVQKICADLGIDFACETLGKNTFPKKKRAFNAENLPGEAELRTARLDFFARAMQKINAKILVQGHQRDDIAETLIMRITRGAGTPGLAAPRPVSMQADGRIFVRPLLEIPKTELLNALRAGEISWREDASNAGTDFFRNRVRNTVLPQLREAAPVENFARARKLAEEDADALETLAAQSPLGETRVPAIVRRQLWKIFVAEKIVPVAKNLDALVAAVCARTPLKFSAGTREIAWDGSRLRVEDSEIAIRRAGENPAFAKNQTAFESDKNVASPSFSQEIVPVTPELFAQIRAGAFDEAETVFLAGTPEIFVRARRAGDRYRPLGAPGEKRVNDAFIDKKIPRARRDALPVFCDGTGIAWIPGLPPAERFRIERAGTKALRLTYSGTSLT